MKMFHAYARYPLSIVAFRLGIVLSLLGISTAIVTVSSILAGMLYGTAVIAVIALTMSRACVRCDYYHSRCDTGLSVVTRRFFKKKENRAVFSKEAQRCGRYLLVVLIFPFGVSILSLIRERRTVDVVLLGIWGALVALYIVTTLKLACPHCRMRDVCPLVKGPLVKGPLVKAA